MFALGLRRGEFPRPPRADPFLTDDELRRRRACAAATRRRGSTTSGCCSTPSPRGRGAPGALLLAGATRRAARSRARPSSTTSARCSTEDFWEPTRACAGCTSRRGRPRRRRRPGELARARAAAGERVARTAARAADRGGGGRARGNRGPVRPASLEAFAGCPVTGSWSAGCARRALEPEPSRWLARAAHAHDLLTARADAAARGDAASGDSTADLACAERSPRWMPTRRRAGTAVRSRRQRGRGRGRRCGGSSATAPPARARRGGGRKPRARPTSSSPSASRTRIGLAAAAGPRRRRGVAAPAGPDRPRRRRCRHRRGARARLQGAARPAPPTAAPSGREERRLQVALYLLAVRRLPRRQARSAASTSRCAARRGPARARAPGRRARAGCTARAGLLCEDDVADDFDARARGGPRDRARPGRAPARRPTLRPCPETCTRRGGCAHPGHLPQPAHDRVHPGAAGGRRAARAGRCWSPPTPAAARPSVHGRAVRRRRCARTGCAVDAILAITFTDKAAAQLRARIRARFARARRGGGARASTERAHVSTIHGFCARVLRGNAVAAGLDPEFQVLDDVRSVRLARARVRTRARRAGGRRRAMRRLELVAAYTAETLRETVVGAARPAALRGRRRSRSCRRRARATSRRRWSELRAALPEAAACVAQARNGQTVAQAAAARRAGGRAGRRAGRRTATRRRAAAAMLPSRSRGRARHARRAIATGAPWPPCARRRLDREALPVLRAARRAARALTRRAYAEAQAGAVARGLRRPRADGARPVPRAPGRSRTPWADATTPCWSTSSRTPTRVQFEILEALDRDNRCMVGDTFQSIYRFRHADVELFDEERARLAGRDGELPPGHELPQRRAVARRHQRRRRQAAWEPAFIPLRAGRGRPRAGRAARRWSSCSSPTAQAGRETTSRSRSTSAPRCRARSCGASPRLGCWASGCASCSTATRYEPGDVAVLLRATADLPLFERALEEEGVPTYLIGGRGYFGHPQVRDLVAWLSRAGQPGRRAAPVGGAGLAAGRRLSTGALVLAGRRRSREARTPWWLLRAAVGRRRPGRRARGAGGRRPGAARALRRPARAPSARARRAARWTA